MAKKELVLVIGPTPPPHHGVAVAIQTLLDSRVKEAFEIRHLDLADRRGIEYVNAPDLHDVFLFIKQWLGFIQILIRDRCKIVYVPISQKTVGFIRDSFFVWPAILVGSRVVIHLHGGGLRTWYETRGRVLKFYVRRLFSGVAHVIVLGNSFRSIFDGLVPAEKISVIPNGIRWNDNDAASIGTVGKRRRYRILHLGTLSQAKGTLVLLAAAAILVKIRRDIEFVFAGEWSRPQEKEQAQSFITQEGFADAVLFTGSVAGQAKSALFRSADLFVFAGVQQEGQPLVVIEAMAAGLPILFTDRGCLRETVIEGENGLEVRCNDPEHLAKQILLLLESPESLKRMGVRSRTRYEAHYTEERYAEKIVALFLKVAKENT
jgi:glycosyltransferase involved in cell wall biosynthesis